MADLTPPVVTIVSVERTKLSNKPEKDSTRIVWKLNEDIVAYTVRVDGVDHTTGTEIEGDKATWFPMFPLDLGLNIPAGTEIETVIEDDDLDLGVNQINFYAKDAAGNWVPYMQD